MFGLEASHVYVGAVGTNWTARLTVTNADGPTTTNYLVTMRANNLTSRVNVAIDEGLWYLHKTQQRNGSEGDWDNLAPNGCSVNPGCDNQNSERAINASNLQAFETSGHLESGPSSDPYNGNRRPRAAPADDTAHERCRLDADTELRGARRRAPSPRAPTARTAMGTGAPSMPLIRAAAPREPTIPSIRADSSSTRSSPLARPRPSSPPPICRLDLRHDRAGHG
jgi:hypothetical protein